MIYFDGKKTRRRKENEKIFQERKRPESYVFEGERLFSESNMRYFGGLHGRMGRKPIPHGYGTLYNPHGVKIFQGEYNMGEKSGSGCTFHRSGAPSQEGVFQDDFIKNGTTYRLDGTIEYKGEYKKGVPHGVGKYIFSDGKSFYEGSFNKGLFEGPGIEKRMRGKLDHVIEGIWNNGKLEDKDEDYLGKRIHSDWDHIIDPTTEVNLNEFWPEDDSECASIIQSEWKNYFYNNILLKIKKIQKNWRNYLRRNPKGHTKTKDKTLWDVAVHAMKEEQSRLYHSKRLSNLKRKLLPVDIIAKKLRRKHLHKLKKIMLPASEMITSEDALAELIHIARENNDENIADATADSTNAMDALLGCVNSDSDSDGNETKPNADSLNAMDSLLGVANATSSSDNEEIIEETEDSKNAMALLLQQS